MWSSFTPRRALSLPYTPPPDFPLPASGCCRCTCGFTWSISLFSRALAIVWAASTPTVFPSRRRALRSEDRRMSRTSSATGTAELGGSPEVTNGQPNSDQTRLKSRLTWFGVVELKTQTLVAQLSIPDADPGERVRQLRDVLRRHASWSVRTGQNTRTSSEEH